MLLGCKQNEVDGDASIHFQVYGGRIGFREASVGSVATLGDGKVDPGDDFTNARRRLLISCSLPPGG